MQWSRPYKMSTMLVVATLSLFSVVLVYKLHAAYRRLNQSGSLKFLLSTLAETQHVPFSLPYMSQISESKLLKETLTFQLNRLPSVVHSRVVHASNRTLFNLGETVNVSIVLYDAFQRPVQRGGDILTVSMNGQDGSSSAGQIIDHSNGSYTGMLRAMWTGSCTIVVNILCTRESLAMTYQLINDFRTSMNLTCVFELESLREITLAYPSTAPFAGKRLCNMTAENYGLPWYCVRPVTPGLLCSDWTKVSTLSYEKFPSFSDNTLEQIYLLGKVKRTFKSKMPLTVRSERGQTVRASTWCNRRDFLYSWFAASPIGFFHNRRWQPALCKYPTDNTALKHCLSNRRLLMFGDSTVRQMFSYIHARLNMTFVTMNWVGKKWHRYTEAERKDGNFQMSWSPHGLPLYFFESGRGVARPVHVAIDEVPAGSHDIVLIHLYAHFHYHHPSVVRNNLRLIARSVTHLLQRAPDVVVAIKGPHSFGLKNRFIGGYWGPTYVDIIKEEFSGLYDKVAYLNYWDMSVALHLNDVHPDAYGVEKMTQMFLGYACTEPFQLQQ